MIPFPTWEKNIFKGIYQPKQTSLADSCENLTVFFPESLEVEMSVPH